MADRPGQRLVLEHVNRIRFITPRLIHNKVIIGRNSQALSAIIKSSMTISLPRSDKTIATAKELYLAAAILSF